jgi:preprotein translocase subunit SecG
MVIKAIQLVIGIMLIIFIIPQTPNENIVLRKLTETGLFTSYFEAKSFLKIFTWGLIGLFLVLTFFLNLT